MRGSPPLPLTTRSRSCRTSKLGQCLFVSFRLAGRAQVGTGEGVDDLAVTVDEERRTIGTTERLVEDAVRPGHLTVGPEVREDREREVLLLAPHSLGMAAVAG